MVRSKDGEVVQRPAVGASFAPEAALFPGRDPNTPLTYRAMRDQMPAMKKGPITIRSALQQSGKGDPFEGFPIERLKLHSMKESGITHLYQYGHVMKTRASLSGSRGVVISRMFTLPPRNDHNDR